MQTKFWVLVALCVLFSFCKNEATKKTSSFPIEEVKKEIEKPIVYDYDTTAWTDLWIVDSSIIQDIKYATEDNFVKEKMYNCGRCLLRPAVAKLVVEAHHILQKKGMGLKLFDCYRPKPIQEKLWKKVPNANYVTPPWKGSMHNRGAAVDLTIVDKNGEELAMGTAYDFFGKEAHHTYTNHSEEIKANRKLLKELMESLNLEPIRTEWWHYSYQKESYPISEMLWECP